MMRAEIHIDKHQTTCTILPPQNKKQRLYRVYRSMYSGVYRPNTNTMTNVTVSLSNLYADANSSHPLYYFDGDAYFPEVIAETIGLRMGRRTAKTAQADHGTFPIALQRRSWTISGLMPYYLSVNFLFAKSKDQ